MCTYQHNWSMTKKSKGVKHLYTNDRQQRKGNQSINVSRKKGGNIPNHGQDTPRHTFSAGPFSTKVTPYIQKFSGLSGNRHFLARSTANRQGGRKTSNKADREPVRGLSHVKETCVMPGNLKSLDKPYQ